MGQGVVNLAGLDFSTVSPGTPDRTKSALGRGVESYPLCDHHVAILPKRLKVIAVVDGGERAKSLQRGTRLEHAILFELHRHGRPVLTWCRHRQRHKLWGHLHMAHGDAYVSTPHVNHRRSTAIVRRVHAQKIGLMKTWLQRQHPVRPLLVRTALV